MGVLVSGNFAATPAASAQDTDTLALPTRKGTAESKASESAGDKPVASKNSGALTRLSQASGHGNVYGAPTVEKKKDLQPEPKQTVSSAKNDEPARKTNSSSSKSSERSSKSSKVETAAGKSSSKSETRKSEEKPAEKKRETAKSEAKPSEESSSGDADVAAVESLRATSRDSEDTADASPEAETDPTVGIEADQALATEMASVPAPVATPPAYVPNVYLPQAQEKRSLLSRIFGRNQEQQPGTAATRQSAFSSDYATRGNAILPTVLDGAGYNGTDLPIGGEDPYRFASLPSSFRPTDLVQIPVANCHYGNQLYLRREAANSLCNMIYDAACQGLNIKVVSAYRDYGHQMRLYTRAVARGGENQKSVARPGKSEHHLGTTVDLTNSEQHTLKRSFGDTPEGQWLAANAHRYGWKMTVMSGNGRRSHNDEPWHLRYLGSSVNANTSQYAIANTNSQPQSSGIVGSVKRLFGLGRR